MLKFTANRRLPMGRRTVRPTPADAMRLVAGGVAILALLLSVASGIPARGEDASAGAAGEWLLEGLDSPLLEGLDSEIQSPETAAQTPDTADQPLDQAGWGEDIGEESSNPLVRIGRRMKTAGDLIGRRETAQTQRVQREIVEDLQRLIEQLQQSSGGQQMKMAASAASAASDDPGDDGAAGVGDAAGSAQPAQESDDRVGRSDEHPARLERMRQTLDQVWGHLPARVREQMHSGMAEEFLPQYEQLIEQYYLRLAEEQQRR